MTRVHTDLKKQKQKCALLKHKATRCCVPEMNVLWLLEAQAAQSWLLNRDWLKCTLIETNTSSHFFLKCQLNRFLPDVDWCFFPPIVTALCGVEKKMLFRSIVTETSRSPFILDCQGHFRGFPYPEITRSVIEPHQFSSKVSTFTEVLL